MRGAYRSNPAEPGDAIDVMSPAHLSETTDLDFFFSGFNLDCAGSECQINIDVFDIKDEAAGAIGCLKLDNLLGSHHDYYQVDYVCL